ncbi:MAG: cytochrome C [Rudaea sp.]|nr:cytochrome C [Rudaea sp.]
MHSLIAISLAIAGAGIAFSAGAQSPPQRLGLCAACHGELGIATGKTIPNLAGQNLEYLRSALSQYRSGARDVAAMRAAAGMLNAAELDQVLQWYAGQQPAESRLP